MTTYLDALNGDKPRFAAKMVRFNALSAYKPECALAPAPTLMGLHLARSFVDANERCLLVQEFSLKRMATPATAAVATKAELPRWRDTKVVVCTVLAVGCTPEQKPQQAKRTSGEGKRPHFTDLLMLKGN